VIAADQHPGRSYAVNLAVRQARSSRLITLDCDDVVAPDYLQAMNTALSVHDFVGARLEPTALNPVWLQARRRALQSESLEPLLGGHHLAVIGAGMAFTRSAFDRVDGFDQGMIALEDLDISYRLQQAGIQPVFVPEAVVHYRYRDNLPGVFRQERNYARYEVLLHRKHRDTLAARRLSRMLRGWGDVLVTAVKVGTRAGRAQFVTALGAATGRIEGSLRYRMFHL
jgi:GT2 family glycosyltransferase